MVFVAGYSHSIIGSASWYWVDLNWYASLADRNVSAVSIFSASSVEGSDFFRFWLACPVFHFGDFSLASAAETSSFGISRFLLRVCGGFVACGSAVLRGGTLQSYFDWRSSALFAEANFPCCFRCLWGFGFFSEAPFDTVFRAVVPFSSGLFSHCSEK